MTGLYATIDPVIMALVRLPGDPYVGFVLGLLLLGLVVTIVGEVSMAGVYLLNRKHFSALSKDMVEHHNLSLKALGAKDKESWRAFNREANDAFGRNFFSYLALFASSLWPVPFALGWLDYRFGGVDFSVPLLGAVGPAFFFIPTYILVRVVFSFAKPHLPLFRHMKRIIRENESGDEMMTYADLARPAGENRSA